MGLDLIYNGVLLGLDAAVIVVALRAARPPASLLALLGAGFTAVLLAGLVPADLFQRLRLLAFALFGHASVLLVVVGLIHRRVAARWPGLLGLLGLLLILVGVDAFLVEPHWLEVTELRLESSRLTQPMRIAVVSDLQADRIGAYETRVVERVMQGEPDLILLPGDYIHENDRRRQDGLVSSLRDLLRGSGFGAPLGAYAVRGNVEWNDWPRIFSGLPVTALTRTSRLELGEITLTAVDLQDSFDSTLRIPASDRFHIAFGHGPDFVLGDVRADLIVAGHTHGGQVRLPLLGPLITFSRIPRSWASGVTQLDDGRTLVVSRGIGMERARAPRMRFLCRPQLLFIDLIPRN